MKNYHSQHPALWAHQQKNKKLSSVQQQTLLDILKDRFVQNSQRHPDMEWEEVQERLLAQPEKLWSLHEMEASGGEPDVVSNNPQTGTFTFYDCSAESPKGRRSICYDREALEARKANKPAGSAMDMAAEMGITILTEAQYRHLQQTGNYDLKTSSWIATPASVRKLGGAIFCDRRYDQVFTYHNGADSYYAARGFRGALEV